MVSSGVDSGIAVTVSMHSDLSTAAFSQTKEVPDVRRSEEGVKRKSSTITDDYIVTDSTV